MSLISRNPGDGIIVRIPPHKGIATLSFDLHNRHTYSADQVKAGADYAAYTATMGVLTMDGTLLARGVVRSEFRTARDLVDRVGGGAGPGGVKAVAPTGTEPIVIEDIPEQVTEVSLLGEKLSVHALRGGRDVQRRRPADCGGEPHPGGVHAIGGRRSRQPAKAPAKKK